MACTRNSDPRAAFATQIEKAAKRVTGRTSAAETPLNVRAAGVSVGVAQRRRIHERVGRKLGKFALHIERATVRLEDVNGPKGGVDKSCRIKVTISGRPSLVVEKQANTAELAFDRALDAMARVLRKGLDEARMSAPNERKRRTRAKRGDDADTASPGVSASDPKVGSGSTARRNRQRNSADHAAVLENSAQNRPSRKSTRRSANRTKRDTPQRLATVAAVRSSSARASAAAHGTRRTTTRAGTVSRS